MSRRSKQFVLAFRVTVLIMFGCATGACGSSAQQVSAPSINAQPGTVDETRLRTADQEATDWLTYGRTYSEQRFSPLTQIDTNNVRNLGLAWWYEMKVNRGVEATPLVADGVMYVTSAWSMVYALDAKTGKELWFYDPRVPREQGQRVCCDVVNRGVALWHGKVYVATIDGRLIALDARTGTPVWERVTVDQTLPYSITGAPRVARNLVFIGNGGAEFGVRGYLSAYDAESGNLRWRFYTVPGDPAKGPDGAASDKPLAEIAAKTWHGKWWNYGGGGTVWDSIVYDPELDYLYVGVGNGGPYDQQVRSPGGGDNLFISSILALRAATGEYVWHYQTTPGEVWDYTASQQITLADVDVGGKPRKLLWQAPKNGFFYVLDRSNGELLSAKPYTTVTWASRIDMKTGRPIEAKNARYPAGTTVSLQPAIIGGHNWQAMAYSPQTRLVYIPVIDMPMPWSQDPGFTQRPGWWNTAVPGPALPSDPSIVAQIRKSAQSFLRAWDPLEQHEAWSVPTSGPWNGGVLATAGGLVFQGTADGRFIAYDARGGAKLWEALTNTATLGTSSAALRRGATLYQTYCWPCHGASAVSSGVLPDLRRSPILRDTTAWKSIVIDGVRKENGMASFAQWINSEDAEALRTYVASVAALAAPSTVASHN